MPPSSGVPQPHPPLKTSKTSPTASTPGAMPPSSGVPRPHPPLKTSKNIPNCIHSRANATFLWRPSTTSTSQNLKKHPRLHPLPERCLLPLAFLNHIHLSKPQKNPRLHPLPERCLLPLASLNHIPLTKPQTYPRLPPMLRADVKKISRTDMRLRHSLSLAFRKKIKCIILIDKRIKTSASVYGKYHTKGGFYHGIQTFWKHDLSSS